MSALLSWDVRLKKPRPILLLSLFCFLVVFGFPMFDKMAGILFSFPIVQTLGKPIFGQPGQFEIKIKSCLLIKQSRLAKSQFSNGPDHWKTQFGGHLVFGRLENPTSKHLVFQCVWYSNVQNLSPPILDQLGIQMITVHLTLNVERFDSGQLHIVCTSIQDSPFLALYKLSHATHHQTYVCYSDPHCITFGSKYRNI